MDTHVNHEAKRPKTLQVVPKFWAQFRILWTSIIALGRTTNANDECDDHDFDADAHDNAKIEIISMIVVTLVMLILTGCFWWWTRMHFQPSWVNPDQIVSGNGTTTLYTEPHGLVARHFQNDTNTKHPNTNLHLILGILIDYDSTPGGSMQKFINVWMLCNKLI